MRTFELSHLHKPENHTVAHVVFAPDGRLVAQSGFYSKGHAHRPDTFHAVEVASGRVESVRPRVEFHYYPALARDGRLIATANHYHASPVVLKMWPLWGEPAEYWVRLAEWGDSTAWLAFAPTGHLWAAVNRGGHGGRTRYSDLLRLDPAAAIDDHARPDARRSLPFASSDRAMLDDGFEVILDWNKADRRDRILAHSAVPAFNADPRYLAVWPEEGPALLLESATGGIVHELPWRGPETSRRRYHRLALSPDGRRVALLGGGKLVCQACDGTGKPWRPKAPVGYVTDAVFTPDGRALLVVDRNGGATRLDAATGKVQASWNWEAGLLLCVAVAPDGALAAAGGPGGKLIVWDLDA